MNCHGKQHQSILTSWGRLGLLLATSRRALDHEVVSLQSKMRELEGEDRILQDTKVIVQEIIATHSRAV